MQQLFLLLDSIRVMSPALRAHLTKILQQNKYRPEEIILAEGQICRHIEFIVSGLVRLYHNLNGVEVTSWILPENNICISPGAFFKQKPTRYWIQAIEATVTLFITHAQLEEICELFPEFRIHRIKIIEDYYEQSEDRLFNLMQLDAEQRYLLLYNENPALLERVPKKYLYSYLDMSQTTFYDIRQSLANRKEKSKNS